MNQSLNHSSHDVARRGKRPNVVYVFGDQHRAQDTGYAGNAQVHTPNLDRLAAESVDFTLAVSVMPVCTPYRATLLTGRYPLTHGVFLNDVTLNNEAVSLADAFKAGGYNTAYIGKWHIDGHGRSRFIPRERRQGFEFWQVLECTHNYNESYYYGDEPVKLLWEGYDAQAQTRSAIDYIKGRDKEKPFLLVLSWGPPHNPYQTAPQQFQELYDAEKLTVRPNVPAELAESVRGDLAGYYAHISALDSYVGELASTLEEEGIAEDTIFVYASDHGDMLGSLGQRRKQRPWDESIRVPFLLRYPRLFGREGRKVGMPFNSPDIMPTLLGLSGLDVPATVEGTDYAPYLRGEADLQVEAALLACISPFGEFRRVDGGREYRGIRTVRYTYVRDLNGPWLMYDNERDPYQLTNVCGLAEYAEQQRQLDELLTRMLRERGDEFLPGEEYIRRWGYVTDAHGTVPYEK
ncbi:MAG: sulfatase, partial [Paenibacillaceae bacterium]|nr:sulfatase [Paenibacillaceae bacterium]